MNLQEYHDSLTGKPYETREMLLAERDTWKKLADGHAEALDKVVAQRDTLLAALEALLARVDEQRGENSVLWTEQREALAAIALVRKQTYRDESVRGAK